MKLINDVVYSSKGQNTFFHLMYEISRMSFLDEKFASFMFKKNPNIPHLIRNFTMNDDIDTSEYRICIIDGRSYNLDFNTMLIKVPKYDKELFFALSFKTFFYNGVKTVTFCIPADMGDVPLDEAMDLYFRYFGQINAMANKAESNFENAIVACMIYTLLLKMIDISITIRGCGEETIAKVLPPSIITKNGLNAYSQLGQKNFVLVDACVNKMQFSIEFMEALMGLLKTGDDINSFIDGTVSTAYAYEMLAMAEKISKKQVKVDMDLLKELHDKKIKEVETFFEEYDYYTENHDEIAADLNTIKREMIDILKDDVTIIESQGCYIRARRAAERIDVAIDAVVCRE